MSVVFIPFAAAVAAASPAPDPTAAAPQAGEIVVTAQKRPQALDDVPVTVTVRDRAQIEAAGVRDIRDLQFVVPGLNTSTTASPAQTAFRIRGVGTVADNNGLESSVGTVIDGVYRARSAVAFGDLGEVSRVEVVKGPQSTLFGKNMSAGVIAVETVAPSFTPAAEVSAGYGNYGAFTTSAMVNGAIAGDVLAGRVYAFRRARAGFWQIGTGAGPRTGTTSDTADNWTVRGQLLFKPRDTVSLRVIGDWSDRDEDCCVNAPSIVGGTAGLVDSLAADAGVVRPARPFARFTYANRATDFRLRDRGLSAQLDWALNDRVSLTSITAYRRYYAEQPSDMDYSSADIWYRPNDHSNRFGVFTQETRLAYAAPGLHAILGAFYYDERLTSIASVLPGADYERYIGLLLPGGGDPLAVSRLTGLPVGASFVADQGQRDVHRQRSRSAALFGDATVEVARGLEVSLGLRFTDERKRLTSQFRNTVPAAGCRAALAKPLTAAQIATICAPTADSAFDTVTTAQRRDEDRLSGSARVQYRVSPEVMAYASYANGFKAGGFNLDRARFAPGVMNPDTHFATERVESYEVGVKTALLGRRLIASLAGFDERFRDYRLNTYTGVSFVVVAIPEVTARGADLDIAWTTGIQGLTLNAGATYADTRFGMFVPPPGINARAPGAALPYAAKWNATGGFTSVQPIGAGLRLTSSASVKWSSGYNTGSNLDPAKRQNPYAVVNARIGVERGALGLELWSQNLTDAHIYQVVIDQPLQAGTYGAFLMAPRTYGATVRARF